MRIGPARPEEVVRLDASRPLFMSVGRVDRDLGPIVQRGARVLPAGPLTSCSASAPRNGPPEAVAQMRENLLGKLPYQALEDSECSLSTGMSMSGRVTSDVTREPPTRGTPCWRARAHDPRECGDRSAKPAELQARSGRDRRRRENRNERANRVRPAPPMWRGAKCGQRLRAVGICRSQVTAHRTRGPARQAARRSRARQARRRGRDPGSGRRRRGSAGRSNRSIRGPRCEGGRSLGACEHEHVVRHDRDEDHAVEAVEEAAVAGKPRAGVLHLRLALEA